MKKLIGLIACVMLLGVSSVFAQSKEVTGTVTDKTDGSPLPGVSVAIKGTNQGTATDINGGFTLKVTPKDVLVFSFVGMKNQEITVGNKTVINVALESDRVSVEEVVIVGYGKVKKSELTGSVVSVKSEELAEKSVSSAVQALQGKVAGVQIVSTSGRTGDNTQISVRGNGSLSASNQVLYVIDGVSQETMGNISPDDIESIEILKDAASTAIYGSRASNGVVLIQTKRGKFNSETVFSISSSYGLQDIIDNPSVLNAAQYKEIHDVARQNFENDIAAGIVSAPKDPDVLTPMGASDVDTDWLGLVKRDMAEIQQHQLSISGGSENTRFYFSGSMYKQQGIIKMDKYQKFRAKLNLDHIVNKHLKFGIQSYFSASESVPMAEDNSMYQPWNSANTAAPNKSPYNEDGSIAEYNFVNPLFAFQRQVDSKWTNLGGSFYFDLKPFEGLTWHSSLSGNISGHRYNRYDAPHTRRGQNGDGEAWGYGYYATDYNRDYLMENTLTYTKGLMDGRLRLTLMAGHSFQKWKYEDSYLQGENFPSDDLRWIVSAGEVNKGRSYYKALALESYFSRLQLSFDGKYNLMVSVRKDGSSKFGKDNRWGTFPAFSAGWNISKEDFFDVSWIDELKVRASYGFTGNQSGISYATGQNLIGSGYNYNNNPGLASGELFNPDLHWEKGEAMNLGLDFTLFNNKLSLSVDAYDKTTNDLLYNVSVVQETGFRTMKSNSGEINNKGFEADLKLNDILGSNSELKWSIGANFSYNKNEVINIGKVKDYYTTGFVSVVKEGESLGSFYLIEAKGVAKETYHYRNAEGEIKKTVQAGDMIYVDQNGDGVINNDDRKVFAGGIAPMYGGLNTSLEYKGFDLKVTAQYSINKKVYQMYKEDGLNGGAIGHPSFSENMIGDMMDYWTPDNMNAANPRPHLSTEISSWNTRRSSRFLDDADYFRITDITLGYNFKNLNIPYIKSMRVYLQGRNLFTFTPYSGIDPEVQYIDPDRENNKVTAGVDNNGIPNMKSYLIGLNLKF